MKQLPRVLAIVPAPIPSVILGVMKPLLALHYQRLLSFNLIFGKTFTRSQLKNIDLVVFCRNMEIIDYRILLEVMKAKIPYVYDIDDNFFEISDKTDLGRHHRDPLYLYILEHFLKNAAEIRVYSDIMLEHAKRYNAQVVKAKPYFDFKLIETLKAPTRDANKIKIIYASSRREQDVAQNIFLQALTKVAVRYKERVAIYIWGPKILDPIFAKLPNVYYLKPIADYKQFIRKFFLQGFDIGLAPGVDDRFHNSKSNNKYREYGACGIAGIYSNTPLYNTSVVQEETGLLVENTYEAWLDALERLIVESALRNKIIEQAREAVSGHYTFEKSTQEWQGIISRVTSQSSPCEYTEMSKTIVGINQFSLAPYPNFLEYAFHMFFKLYFYDHQKAYQKGVRNFIVQLNSVEDIKILKDFSFYENARYVIMYSVDFETQALKWKTALVTKNNLYFWKVRPHLFESAYSAVRKQLHFYDLYDENPYLLELTFLADEFFLSGDETFRPSVLYRMFRKIEVYMFSGWPRVQRRINFIKNVYSALLFFVRFYFQKKWGPLIFKLLRR